MRTGRTVHAVCVVFDERGEEVPSRICVSDALAHGRKRKTAKTQCQRKGD